MLSINQVIEKVQALMDTAAVKFDMATEGAAAVQWIAAQTEVLLAENGISGDAAYEVALWARFAFNWEA